MVKGKLIHKIRKPLGQVNYILEGGYIKVEDIKDHLQKFRRYLQNKNFDGSVGYLKKNILTQFDEEFGKELTGGSS